MLNCFINDNSSYHISKLLSLALSSVYLLLFVCCLGFLTVLKESTGYSHELKILCDHSGLHTGNMRAIIKLCENPEWVFPEVRQADSFVSPFNYPLNSLAHI